jgi:hypothetical protein
MIIITQNEIRFVLFDTKSSIFLTAQSINGQPPLPRHRMNATTRASSVPLNAAVGNFFIGPKPLHLTKSED